MTAASPTATHADVSAVQTKIQVRVFDIGVDLTITQKRETSGSFGDIFSATICATNEVVILKQYRDYHRKIGMTDDAFKELLLLQHLNAFPETKTVKCHGIAFGPNADDLYLVLEKLDTDLAFLLTTKSQSNQSHRLTEPQICALFYKILHALNAIHCLGIIHNDVKPHNIMLVQTADGDVDIRLVDFGFSEFVGIGPTRRLSRHYRCTKKYKAPDDPNTSEQYTDGTTSDYHYFDGNRKSFVSDVYSVAVTMVCLFAGGYYDVRRARNELHIDGLHADDHHVRWRTHLSHDGRGLLLAMLEHDTTRRITCAQALTHPYFADERRAPVSLVGSLRHVYRVHSRLVGGMSPTRIQNWTSRHEHYTRVQYDARAFELACMEDMHVHYMHDVIPCVSTKSTIGHVRALFEWLLEKLHAKTRRSHLFDYGYHDYPLTHESTHAHAPWAAPIFVFETLDIILNGTALAAYVLESGRFTNDRDLRLTGLVACHIYAAVCEFETTSVDTLVASARCTRDDFITSCMSVVRTCNANFPFRPVWLHLHYMWLKLAYEPRSGVYAGHLDDARLASLMQDAIPDILFYYYFFIKPAEDFTVWNVVQYSVTRALAISLGVDIGLLSENPLNEHLLMTNFATIHRHYETQRLDLTEL
jgi:serine/threonine protein kinase